MNDLSWMIYFADISPSLARFVGVVSCVLAVISAFMVMIYVAGSEETHERYTYDSDGRRSGPPIVEYTDAARSYQRLRFTLWTAPLFLLLCGASNLMPSKETIYLIAASESGEYLLETPEAAKAMAVVNKWLDKQLADDAPKDAEK